MRNNKECFPIAAERHYTDSQYLLQHGRKDNAICHLAFSAECTLKTFWEAYHKMNNSFREVKEVHSEEKLNDFLREYYWLTIKNPSFAFLTDLESIPSILFQDHPERRYYEDQPYTVSVIEQCRRYAETLLKRLVECALDGQITGFCTYKENT